MVEVNLLARQETMPFHIQIANPQCYRGLPVSLTYFVSCLSRLPSLNHEACSVLYFLRFTIAVGTINTKHKRNVLYYQEIKMNVYVYVCITTIFIQEISICFL